MNHQLDSPWFRCVAIWFSMAGYVFGCISGIVFPCFNGFFCAGRGVFFLIFISKLDVVAFSVGATQYPESPYRIRLNRAVRALDVVRYQIGPQNPPTRKDVAPLVSYVFPCCSIPSGLARLFLAQPYGLKPG